LILIASNLHFARINSLSLGMKKKATCAALS